MPYHRTAGVALRCTDFSETSQVAAWITPDLGQIHTLAKGSRRPHKDGRGPLDLLQYCDIVLARRPTGQLHLLTEWTVRESFPGLRRDLGRLWASLYAGEVCMALTTENSEDGPFCGHLAELLRRLNVGSDIFQSLFIYLGRSLKTHGSMPTADRCAACGRPPSEFPRFSPHAGGALCADCARQGPRSFPISKGALAIMARVTTREEIESSLRLSPAQRGEIQRAFNEQIQYHLGRPLRSAHLVEQLLTANREVAKNGNGDSR